mmetsp:Transcript_26063/g.35923  ORF Transcript_26063/g.35923 Transcript_26063/m.35923 type:complete len:92 (+) Transcript_26063:601-876(+)
MEVSEGDSPTVVGDSVGEGTIKRPRSESLSSPPEEARPHSSVFLPNRPASCSLTSPVKRRRACPLPYSAEEMSLRVTQACSLLSLDNQSLG